MIITFLNDVDDYLFTIGVDDYLLCHIHMQWIYATTNHNLSTTNAN
jgi:hypothetical protein